jgi:hypothetical protein
MQCRADSRQKFDGDDNMSILSSTDNKVYRVQQKEKTHQLDGMNMWTK